jgi:hypothetical protein
MRKKWMLSSTAIETITSIQVRWEVLPRTSSAFSTWAAMSGNGVKTSLTLKTKTVCCVVHVGTMDHLRAFFTPRIDTTRYPIREVITQAFVVSWLGSHYDEALLFLLFTSHLVPNATQNIAQLPAYWFSIFGVLLSNLFVDQPTSSGGMGSAHRCGRSIRSRSAALPVFAKISDPQEDPLL